MRMRSMIVVLLIVPLFASCARQGGVENAESGHESLSQVISPTPLSTVVPSHAQTSTLEPTEVSIDHLISEEVIAPYFSEFSDATMVLFDGTTTVVLNETLAQKRQSPYSTFKIPNSLIALEEDAISKEQSVIEWDGQENKRAELNQDQDLASAFKNSCLWYYKVLAKRVGQAKMRKDLNALNYGNKNIEGGIDSFWIDSSLEISPMEQVDFLYKLYYEELPFLKENISYVKLLMKQDAYPMELYGKTGSSGKTQGWFVGYTFVRERPVFFATYIEGQEVSGLIARDVTAKVFEENFVDSK